MPKKIRCTVLYYEEEGTLTFTIDLTPKLRPAVFRALETPELSFRERQVIEGVVIGKQMKEISSDLNLSVSTIKHHSKNAYKKLGMDRAATISNLRRLVKDDGTIF